MRLCCFRLAVVLVLASAELYEAACNSSALCIAPYVTCEMMSISAAGCHRALADVCPHECPPSVCCNPLPSPPPSPYPPPSSPSPLQASLIGDAAGDVDVASGAFHLGELASGEFASGDTSVSLLVGNSTLAANETTVQRILAILAMFLSFVVAMLCFISATCFVCRRRSSAKSEACAACTGSAACCAFALLAIILVWWAIASADPISMDEFSSLSTWDCSSIDGCWTSGTTMALFLSWTGMALFSCVCCGCALCIASNDSEVLVNPRCHDRYEHPANKKTSAIQNEMDKIDDDSELGLIWGPAIGHVESDGSMRVAFKGIFDDDVSLTSGLKWKHLDSQPTTGVRLDNAALAMELSKKRRGASVIECTPEELETLGVSSLTTMHFVHDARSNSFFQPAPSTIPDPTSVPEHHIIADDDFARHVKERLHDAARVPAGGLCIHMPKEQLESFANLPRDGAEGKVSLTSDHVIKVKSAPDDFDGYFKPVTRFESMELEVLQIQHKVDHYKRRDERLRRNSWRSCAFVGLLLLLGCVGVLIAWTVLMQDSTPSGEAILRNSSSVVEYLDNTPTPPPVAPPPFLGGVEGVLSSSGFLLSGCNVSEANMTTELSPMASFFFNDTCIRQIDLVAGTCAAEKVNAFAELFAGGWRIESEIGNVFALVALVILMQLGGIPRPNDAQGKFFWFAWMSCQISQILIVSFALALVICGYSAVQAQIYSCMIKIDGALPIYPDSCSRPLKLKPMCSARWPSALWNRRWPVLAPQRGQRLFFCVPSNHPHEAPYAPHVLLSLLPRHHRMGGTSAT